ncbi:hypothetical protein D3273_01170 [Lichenibacterium minor]|uniref:Uncharacterized protein n=1 Tax=Lichenibacterium minor TaxID=2316528 RepID=A0A4Q2UBB5_9HYPH|nr:hypothetical protein [Lichenibacterium minor]RYC33892.1 hypothetical protein D3273_01170 [Lichenibacterium minor]
MYRLSADERDLVKDAVSRGASTFLDTRASRAQDIAAASEAEVEVYARAVCGTVNAVLRVSGRRHLVACVAAMPDAGGGPLDRFASVRFAMRPGRAPRNAVVDWDRARADDSVARLRTLLMRSPTPYLRERRHVRLYGEGDVTVIKPVQRRYWNVASGLMDGDAILADHWLRRSQ